MFGPARWLTGFSGPLLTACVLGLVEAAATSYPALAENLHQFPLVLLALVVASALYSGLWGGLASAGIAAVYGAVTLSTGSLLHFSAPDLRQWLGLMGASIALAVLGGLLKERSAAQPAVPRLRLGEDAARALASIGEGILTTDYLGRVTFLNPAAAELTGWGEDEALGKPLDEVYYVIHQVTHERVLHPHLSGANQEGVRLWEHTVLLARDGREVPISASASPIRDDQGIDRGMVILFRDATAHQLAQETLRTSEEWYRRIVDTAHEGIWVLDAQARTQYVNWRMAEMLGYSVDEIQGRALFDFVHMEEEPGARRLLDRLKNGINGQRDLRFSRKDDTELWVSTSASAILNDRGEYVGALAMVTDVSERRRLEEELRLWAEELTEAGRRKDEFLAMLAHELRNPLGAIRNALQVLHTPQANPSARARAMDVVERQVAHQARMVDDLLDVSRITRGRVELRPDLLDVARLARDTAEDYRAQVERASLELRVSLPEQPVLVTGDRTRLAQVIGNLLHNAVKFSNSGGAIEVSVATSAPGETDGMVSGWAEIRIRDNGIGIDGATLARVFEPFVQADRSLDRSRGGLGLGLALVKGLVELHGGRVSAASPGHGRGSVFEIRLPVAEASPLPAANPAPSTLNPQHSTPTRRVLVIEDNLDAAETLGDLLEMAGHEVRLAHSGPAGVSEAGRFRPEIVLCDVGLPEMDGYAVARALRDDPRTHEALLVAVTGYGQEEDRRRSLEAGFDLHLTKPVDPQEVQRLVGAGQVVR
jgi:PAS domain S-box-containing protein